MLANLCNFSGGHPGGGGGVVVSLLGDQQPTLTVIDVCPLVNRGPARRMDGLAEAMIKQSICAYNSTII